MTYAPHLARLATPIGMVEVTGDAAQITSVTILSEGAPPPLGAPPDTPVAEAVVQLAAWFAGERSTFDLPLMSLSSPRGMALRSGIAAIPYGKTLSYGALARMIGSAPRAVGQACRRNPFPIIIPCHRVTSSSGPEHYSGGAGVPTKAWLIAFEAQQSGKARS